MFIIYLKFCLEFLSKYIYTYRNLFEVLVFKTMSFTKIFYSCQEFFFNLFHPLQWYLMSCLLFNLNKFLYVYEDFHYSLFSIDWINTWTLILDIKNQSNREVFMLIFASLQLRAEFFGLKFIVWICDIVFRHKFRKPCYFVIRFVFLLRN